MIIKTTTMMMKALLQSEDLKHQNDHRNNDQDDHQNDHQNNDNDVESSVAADSGTRCNFSHSRGSLSRILPHIRTGWWHRIIIIIIIIMFMTM